MTVAAIPRANAWVGDRLMNDATLSALVGGRIYRRRIPQGAGYPLVVYQHEPGAGTAREGGGAALYEDMVYAVKAVGETQPEATSNAALVPIMDRVNALLDLGAGATPGGYVWFAQGEDEFEYDDPDGWHAHLGRRYRIHLDVS